MSDPSSERVPGTDRSVLWRGMALLWRSVRTHPLPFAVSMVGASVFAVMTVAATAVLGRVTDDVIVPALTGERGDGAFGSVDAGTVAAVTAAVLVVALVRAAGVVARRFFCATTTFRMGVTWRTRLAERYLGAPLRFHTRRPAGVLMAHADNDTQRAVELINPAPFSISALLLGVVAFGRLMVVDWVLAVVALVVFPTLLVLNRIYTTRVEGPAARGQARYGDMAGVAHESFDGALIVRLLGLAEHESARMRAAAERLRRERVRVGELRAWFEPGLTALPNLGSVAVLGLGAWRLSTGDVTEGGIVEALALFAVLTTPMRIMGYLLQTLPPSVVAADRLDDVLARDPAERHPARGAHRLPSGPLAVELDGVRVAYVEGAPVLEDVDLRLAPGEVVALTGATAGGKSTLCATVAGLLEPDGGVVRLDGVAVADIDPASLPGTVGVVFQESFLFADTVRANVLAGLPDDWPEAEVRDALHLAQAERFVDALPDGLDSVLGERGVTLSGGQRQRLALARALLRRPGLLILDDATSAVDPSVEEQILAGLRSRLDTTTLVVAHRVSTIRLADRVAFLDRGRIVATGAHDHLLATVPAYAALVQAYALDEAAETWEAGDDDLAPEVL